MLYVCIFICCSAFSYCTADVDVIFLCLSCLDCYSLSDSLLIFLFIVFISGTTNNMVIIGHYPF